MDTEFDEFITCKHSFQRLKDLVVLWYEDFLREELSAGYLL
jgi:hypothetical protein